MAHILAAVQLAKGVPRVAGTFNIKDFDQNIVPRTMMGALALRGLRFLSGFCICSCAVQSSSHRLL